MKQGKKVFELESMHILVIDDNPESIRRLLLAMHTRPWKVTLATDGRQGYQRAQLLAPDLILLDVLMPGMGGFAMCRLLQAAPQTRGIPILFLTSANASNDRLQGLLNGGSDYIVKSCEPAELLARVEIHLRLAQRRSVEPIESTNSPLAPDEVILHAAMRFLGENLAEPLSLQEIAIKVGTYDKRLSAIFRQQLGMTVFSWIREERLRRGRKLLAETSLNMQDVATHLGFHSACNFATAFRERMGVTPSQYRRELQSSQIHTRSCHD